MAEDKLDALFTSLSPEAKRFVSLAIGMEEDNLHLDRPHVVDEMLSVLEGICQ